MSNFGLHENYKLGIITNEQKISEQNLHQNIGQIQSYHKNSEAEIFDLWVLVSSLIIEYITECLPNKVSCFP